jgi:16S rRNA (guanine527-N7)-methyltransferase
MDINLTDLQVSLLLDYIQLFHKWNKTYNLSAIRDIESQVDRHLLDSLSVVPYIEADNVIDVGTGGGLPGIPLAIMFPEKKFTLLDSAGKKTRFLFQVKTQLKLDNVQVENRRVESFQPECLFDAVISRAFASLKDMTDNCQHLLANDGVFYAMKGIYPTDELSEVEKNYKVSDSYPLQIPREDGERHLLVLTR